MRRFQRAPARRIRAGSPWTFQRPKTEFSRHSSGMGSPTRATVRVKSALCAVKSSLRDCKSPLRGCKLTPRDCKLALCGCKSAWETRMSYQPGSGRSRSQRPGPSASSGADCQSASGARRSVAMGPAPSHVKAMVAWSAAKTRPFSPRQSGGVASASLGAGVSATATIESAKAASMARARFMECLWRCDKRPNRSRRRGVR